MESLKVLYEEYSTWSYGICRVTWRQPSPVTQACAATATGGRPGVGYVRCLVFCLRRQPAAGHCERDACPYPTASPYTYGVTSSTASAPGTGSTTAARTSSQKKREVVPWIGSGPSIAPSTVSRGSSNPTTSIVRVVSACCWKVSYFPLVQSLSHSASS